MTTRSALGEAKRAYVTGMRRAGSALVRAKVVGAEPPKIDDRWRHWAFSLTRVHDSLALADLDVPWWTYRAIDVVDAWLAARPRPIRVFEYGSGASTLWLAARADEVHSVEHHRQFAELMAQRLREAPNVRLTVVEPVAATAPVVPSAKEGYGGLDFADYVATIDRVAGRFDLIVIDGRAREACLAAAVAHLAPSGIVLFDNSRRRRYRKAIAGAGLVERRLTGLTPTLPYPEQTSILTFPDNPWLAAPTVQ
jgi:Methyltransferase domain